MKIGTCGFCALLCILCLLLVGGCGASAKTGDVFFTDLNQADRIIISVEPQANPKVKSPAKICTRESDLAALKETIGQFEIGQATETIYGGENIVILLYQGDTLLHRIALHDNGLCHHRRHLLYLLLENGFHLVIWLFRDRRRKHFSFGMIS